MLCGQSMLRLCLNGSEDNRTKLYEFVLFSMALGHYYE